MEAENQREQRRRLTTDDFDPLVIIGRGAFGEVRLVKKKASGDIYAMKSMIKEAMVRKNQVKLSKYRRRCTVYLRDTTLPVLLLSLHSRWGMCVRREMSWPVQIIHGS